MNKIYVTCLIGAVAWCTAAQACSPRLDGGETYCPPFDEDIKLPREEIRGEVDVYDPNHWQQMQYFWLRNARREQIEKNMTQPDDALDSALAEYFKNK